MRILFVACLLVGRLLAAVPCAEHNIYLSTFANSVSKTGDAKCTTGTVGGITYTCTNGGMSVWGFDIESECETNYVSYAVQTVDPLSGVGHKYDLGVFYIKGPSEGTLAGHIMTHIGYLDGTGGTSATSFTPATGLLATAKTWAVTAACPTYPCTLPAGQYGLALATDCTASCAALWGDDNKGFMYLFYVWLGGSGGSDPTGVNGPPLVVAGCTSTCAFNLATAPGLPATITPPLTDPGLWHAGFTRPPAVLIF